MLSQDLFGTLTRCQIRRNPPPSASCKEREPDLWVPYVSYESMDAILEAPILPLKMGGIDVPLATWYDCAASMTRRQVADFECITKKT